MERAAKIASELSDTNRWNSHGYGISKDVLNDLGVMIVDFNADPSLKNAVQDCDHLLQDYLYKLRSNRAVHVKGRLVYHLS